MLRRSPAGTVPLWLAALLVTAPLVARGAPGAALDAGPEAGASPSIQVPVRRIVSMNPSLTAILVALGSRELLVGVDEYSARQQPEVADLPTVGGLYNPSAETVAALRPDLVVLVPSVEQRDFRKGLEALGISILELDPLRFDEVLAAIETLGERVGRGKAAGRRVAAIRRARAEIERERGSQRALRGVLVLTRDPLFVVGGGSFIDEMLAVVGVENLARALESPYPRVSLEWLVAAQPEVIVDAAGDAEAAQAFWARWPSLPAVRNARVVSIPQGVATLPGPYLDRGLETLAEAVHGAGTPRLAP
jgi:ABC-type Fe3+-hydroxamate transport system substrate-binding protein